MKPEIFISGSSGFIGKNIIRNLSNNFTFYKYIRKTQIQINSEIVIHSAGLAHDTKNKYSYNDYYEANYELTKKIFDQFLNSNAKIFIYLSSIKALTDFEKKIKIDENYNPNPSSDYGKSKLLSEKYILSKKNTYNKKIYILRPCMIHGKGNKGNLNLLYKIVKSGIPWPLGKFENQRSFCSIDNLLFIMNELIINKEIPSGVYNIADDDPLSTNEIIKLISYTTNRKIKILMISKKLIVFIAKIGEFINLPLNLKRLKKLTESCVVDNSKIKKAINKPLPLSSMEGMEKTLKSFV